MAGLTLAGFLAAAAVIWSPIASADGRALEIDVWSSHGDNARVNRGEPVDIYFETSKRARVIVYGIDAEGWVHVLYPTYSWKDNCVRPGRTYRVASRCSESLRCGPDGLVLVGAVAARERFPLARWFDCGETVVFCGDRSWCLPECPPTGRVIGRVVGDPFEAVWAIEDRLVPHCHRDRDFAADLSWYTIGPAGCHTRVVWVDRDRCWDWDPDLHISLGVGVHWDWPRRVIRHCVRPCDDRWVRLQGRCDIPEPSEQLKWKEVAAKKPKKEWNKSSAPNVIQGREQEVERKTKPAMKKEAMTGKPDAAGTRYKSIEKSKKTPARQTDEKSTARVASASKTKKRK
jgi:hypothetical protein